MATLTAQSVVEAGLEASYDAAAAGGDAFVNDGNKIIHVLNGSGGDLTLTVTAQKTTATKPGFGSLTKSNVAVVITAAEERFIGPFPTSAFNDGNGLAQITYSGVTDLTIAILDVPNVR